MWAFSEKTKALLISAGWKEKEKRDPTGYVKILEREGYTVFPVVNEFLQQFGGLRVTKGWARNFENWIDFRIDQVLRNLQKWEVEVFSEYLHIELCPIACDNNSNFFVMSSDGKVYGLYYIHAFLIGDSGEEAVEALLTYDPKKPFHLVLTITGSN